VLDAAAGAQSQDRRTTLRRMNRSVSKGIDANIGGGAKKNWEWIKRGVPDPHRDRSPVISRLARFALSRRDQSVKEKVFKPSAEIVDQLPAILGKEENSAKTCTIRAKNYARLQHGAESIRRVTSLRFFFTPQK